MIQKCIIKREMAKKKSAVLPPFLRSSMINIIKATLICNKLSPYPITKSIITIYANVAELPPPFL